MPTSRWIYTLPLRLRSIFRRDRVEHEMDEELRYHLEAQIALHVAHGMSPAAARGAALRSMGQIERHRDAIRDTRRVEWVWAVIQDVRYGVRLLGRSPGFALAALSTVAIGIASTTVMFSIAYGVLLQPLPFDEPERLVNVWSTSRQGGRLAVSAANGKSWRERNHVFEDLAVYHGWNFNLADGGEPERLNGVRMTANALSILRTTPMIGRRFTEEENEIGRDNVVLLSHGLWLRRFGGDSGIVGRKLDLNGIPYFVVGVMPPEFAYPSRQAEVWTPLAVPASEYSERTSGSYQSVARLEPGVTLSQARADLTRVSAELAVEYPGSNRYMGADLAPFLDDTVRAVKKPLAVLLAAVGALLLIGCANLANLLLARSLARQREVSVRAALGASRVRLVMHSLGELSPILVVGGGIGVSVAAALVRLLPSAASFELPRVENIRLSLPVLGASVGALLFIVLVACLWPAMSGARADLAETIGQSSRGAAGSRRGGRVRDALVVAQVATTLLLFVGAMVLMRSFIRLQNVDPGFRPEGVLSAFVAIPSTRFPTDADVAEVSRRFMERIRAMPNVEAVGMVNRLPLVGNQTGGLEFEGVELPRGKVPVVGTRTATPAYFAAMRIPLYAGRSFTEADRADAPPVVVITDRLARHAFGNQSPLGKRVRRWNGDPWSTIVGVVGHVRDSGLDQGDDAMSQAYWSYHQRTQERMAIVVRTSGDPAALARPLALAVRDVEPTQPLYDVRPLEDVVERWLGTRRLQAAVLGAFAAIALLLASIGVYGVVAYGVSQRLREFGIRMALGARRADVIGLVLGRGARVIGTGVVLGLVAALASVRVLDTLVFGVQPLDAPSFVIAAVVLLGVGSAACLIPARRAARADPTVALRSE